jgi:hypothetical protein
VNALSKPEVGKYINEHFVASFQKVATFQIVDGAKQGGNVAAYFCAPDGRVLHVVAGPVDAATMLKEAKWVVEAAKDCVAKSKESGKSFKSLLREAHALKLRNELGLVVDAAEFDVTDDDTDPVTARDPSGRPLVPVPPPPPIDGPDVSFRHLQEDAAKAGAAESLDRRGGRIWNTNQGRVHQILAAYASVKIERVYGTIFENILGEKVSTAPVVTINSRGESRREVCLHCESKAAQK